MHWLLDWQLLPKECFVPKEWSPPKEEFLLMKEFLLKVLALLLVAAAVVRRWRPLDAPCRPPRAPRAAAA